MDHHLDDDTTHHSNMKTPQPALLSLKEKRRYPTAEQPLLGKTVLLVEDSRFTCEAVRLMCLRSGARIRRADTLGAAARHLRVYRPTILMVDLGLPDGDGLDLIRSVARHRTPIEVIMAISGDDSLAETALKAGAHGFLSKPIASLASFQEKLLNLLPEDQRPMEPRVVNDGPITPDPLCYREDLKQADILLNSAPDAATAEYVTQFLITLSRSAGDTDLLEASMALDLARLRQGSPDAALAKVTTLLHKRLQDLPNI